MKKYTIEQIQQALDLLEEFGDELPSVELLRMFKKYQDNIIKEKRQ